MDTLWGEEPPASATTTLHGYVATLRRALEPLRGAGRPAVLVREGPGYALRLGADALDVDRFTRDAEQAHAAVADGDPRTAVETGRRALALWQGPALSGCSDASFVASAAAGLEDLRLSLSETVWAAALDLGEHERVAVESAAQVADHPLRERSWELLALARYRCGRQGDALAALRAARDVLDRELGADPGPALVALTQAVLRQDPSLDAPDQPVPAADSPDQTPRWHRPTMPTPPTPFRGRAGDIERVLDLVAAHPLVTVAGPGGMGKTRLALAVAGARDVVDGRWFVDLSAVGAGSGVIEVVAGTLGGTATTAAQLAGLVADRELLLVLDNCEHVVAEVAAMVAELLALCARLRVLITSRTALLLPGEQIYALGPMPPEEAAALFVERARAADPAWSSGPADGPVIDQLCAELDGMPLAIELAAAQCRVLSVAQVAVRVADRTALRWSARRGPGRHATVAAALEGSVEMLTPAQRGLLRDLTVFCGGFDLDAVVAVTGDPNALLALADLVDASLVVVEGGDPKRYRLLQVVRSVVAEGTDQDARARVADRHVAWVRGFTADADRSLRGHDSPTVMDLLARESANVRAALDHALTADPVSALHIAAGVYWFWFRRGPVTEGYTRLAAALAAVAGWEADVPLGVRVRAEVGAVLLAYLRGDLPALKAGLARVGELGARAVEPVDRAYAFAVHAFFAAGGGDTDRARQSANIALESAAAPGTAHIRAEALMCLGTASFRDGDHAAAERELTEARTTAAAVGYTWCTVSSAWLLAKSWLAGECDLPVVAGLLVEAAEECLAEDDVTSWVVVVATLAHVARRGGVEQIALELTGAVLQRGSEVGLDPAAMDPHELAAWSRELHDAVAPDVREAGLARGRTLTPAQVRNLCLALPGTLGSRPIP